jgi:CelD/BcsL family acetyltransferase involved in cellulose biosynthesis
MAAAQEGILRVAILSIADRVAAMQIGVESGGRYWLLKVGYREEYAKYSPGVLLMIATIRHAVQHGLDSYEWLGSEEPWIRSWTKVSRACVGMSAYPARPRGLVAIARDAASAGTRALRDAASGSQRPRSNRPTFPRGGRTDHLVDDDAAVPP